MGISSFSFFRLQSGVATLTRTSAEEFFAALSIKERTAAAIARASIELKSRPLEVGSADLLGKIAGGIQETRGDSRKLSATEAWPRRLQGDFPS